MVIAGVLLVIVVGIQVKNAVFIEYKVEGVSMNPTFQEGNELLINRFAHRFKTISRFDIVLFKGPDKDIFIKRVIGLPGETLRYEDDQLYINEEKIKEPYLDDLKAVTAGGDLTGDFTLQEVTGKGESALKTSTSSSGTTGSTALTAAISALFQNGTSSGL